MKDISVFGTSSDAGKSTLSFALTYLLFHKGIKVAPFKAQNVSNNSHVCDEGGEIAIPQFFAAESIGIKTSPKMNPVLLKSGRENRASVIVNGYALDEKDVREYYKDLDSLKPIVKKAFEDLQEDYECIVAEGAGSPVELNLMDKDLSNIYIATEFNTKIILIADIEKGGVFASIYGVYNLLPPQLQKNVIGVIINKFRGDVTLFDKGREIIEKEFGLKVLGLIPFKPFNLGFEDSQSLMNYTKNKPHAKIRVGIIKLPFMSNFTDFEPLINDTNIHVDFIDSTSSSCDVLIIPGSKRVIQDLRWLKDRGFEKEIKNFKGKVIGICGGYEMMFKELYDEDGIEEDKNTREKGFGFIDEVLEFKKEKTLKKGVYNVFNMQVSGYEIHHGHCKNIYFQKENIYGTFLHGLFDNDNFRELIFEDKGYNFTKFKKDKIASYASFIEKNIDLDYILKEIS